MSRPQFPAGPTAAAAWSHSCANFANSIWFSFKTTICLVFLQGSIKVESTEQRFSKYVVPEPAASAPPETLSEMHFFKPHPQPFESESLGVGPRQMSPNQVSRGFRCKPKREHCGHGVGAVHHHRGLCSGQTSHLL